MLRNEGKPEEAPLIRLYSLTDRIATAESEADLADVEGLIDNILKGELQRQAAGGADTEQSAAFGLATHRLEHLITQRRSVIASKRAPVLQS